MKTLPLLTLSLWTTAALAAPPFGPPAPEARFDEVVAAYQAIGQFDGTVLVARDGRVVYQRAIGDAVHEWGVPATMDTAYRIASLTKQFTAALVLKLAEQGRLRLDDRVGRYVPELRHGIGERVTLHHLLSHTSGIADYVNHPGFWRDRLGEKVPRADILAIMNRDLDFEPGTSARYSSSGYYLLGLVLEKAGGKPWDTLLDELILRPLSMTRSGYEATDRLVERRALGYTRTLAGGFRPADPMHMPNVWAGGGMYSTAPDLLRWERALAGDTLLSPKSKALMFTAYAPDDVLRDLGFGYGWLVGTRRLGGRDVVVHEHGGNANGFRTLITRYPEDQSVIVILANEGSGNISQPIYRMRADLTALLRGEPVTLPRRPFASALAQAIASSGVASAMAALPSLREQAAAVDGPSELNVLGYGYLIEGRMPEAVAVMALNAELYPSEGNAFDSLGEVLLAAGERARAIAAYRRALELDPKNTNAAEVLQRLGAK